MSRLPRSRLSILALASAFLVCLEPVRISYAGGIVCACRELLKNLDPNEVPTALKLPHQPQGVLAAVDVGDRPILALAFLEYGKVLAIAEAGPPQRDVGPPGRVVLYDLSEKSPRQIGEIHATSDQIIALASHPFHYDLLIAAGGRWDQRLQSWKRAGDSWKPVADISSFSNWWMKSLAVSEDGKTLATLAAPEEGTLRLWNLSDSSLEPAQKLEGPSWATSATAFSQDGKFVAAGTGSGHSHPNDGQILLWNLQATPPKLISNVAATEAASRRDVTALTFTSQDGQLASADQAGFIRTWKLTNAGKLESEHKFLAHQNGVQSLHALRNGQLLSAGNDGTVASWETATGKLQRRWNFGSQSALVALAPSAEHCAVGLTDGRVYILHLPTEE